MSLPEVLLWQRLKGSPQGIAFRKQHPIGPYKADFYCAAAKLVIEVDGAAHDMGDRPRRDAERTAWLQARSYRVVRIPASEILRDADAAAQSIVSFAANPLHRASGTVPLPVNGEDPKFLSAQPGGWGGPPLSSSFQSPPRDGEGNHAQRGGGGSPQARHAPQ